MSLTSMAVRAAYKGGKKAVKAQQARNAAARAVEARDSKTEGFSATPRNSVLDSIKDSEANEAVESADTTPQRNWDGTWG
jgi:hypothetical protein